ncbi:beta strand repeat-containing protein [Bradyrhizobium sp. 930_D9_N1_4]|uniref:beta strand repeat-containing protein n=1 Tax=Bradyrhizobium sp. 930_D9_N1_4 TaxID=3240374 RepID=UPI003F89B818
MAAPVVKLGSEFSVPTNTSGSQEAPVVTGLANGGFVVTWDDTSGALGDASGTAIKAQIYAADGSKIGSEFRVNTETNDDQIAPVITGLSNGGFVVTWFDNSQTLGDSEGTSIKAQVFSANGTPVGSETLVNSSTSYSQFAPTVTGLANGGFAITWTDDSGEGGDDDGTSIKAQLFAADGSKVGSEFLVNTETGGSQDNAVITGLANGGFVVTWEDLSGTLGDDDATRVKAQVFAADGSKVGGEFLVNTATSSDQLKPTVSALPNGGFVVTWYDFSQTGGDTSGSSIKAQIYAADGSKVGGDFLVNTTTANSQFTPAVTALSNGDFAVAWQDWSGTGGDASGSSIKLQVFTADGRKVGAELLVNTSTTSNQLHPSIAAYADGRFVVTWQDANGTDVKAQVFSVDTVKPVPVLSAVDATSPWVAGLSGSVDADAAGQTLTLRDGTSQNASWSTTVTVGSNGAWNAALSWEQFNTAVDLVVTDVAGNTGVSNYVYGTASGRTFGAGSHQYIYGTATDYVIGDGAQQQVYAGGTVIGTTLNAGGVQVDWGNAIGTTINGGAQYVWGTASNTTIVAGAQYVGAGGSASGTTIGAGGLEYIHTGGTLTDVTFGGASARLVLDQSSAFSGTISGWQDGAQLDLGDIAFGGNTSLAYAANAGNTGGTLTVTDGVHTAALQLLGQYSAADFALAADGNGGSIITNPVDQPQAQLSISHAA